MDAVMQVRDAIAYSESTTTPLCILSLDFQQTFNRISHQFLFNILQAYGITPWFCDRIKTLYTNVTATIQVNVKMTRSFPIKSGVRQGCPLSMVLYGLCLHPLLRTLESQLTGFSHISGTVLTPILAYAGDITVMVTQPTDFSIIKWALTTYGKSSGAILKPLKSRALPTANWSFPATELGIAFCTEVKILGISFGATIRQSINDSWKSTTQTVSVIARKSFHRSLCLAQKIQYVRLYLFAKIWYVAQTFPPTIERVKQLKGWQHCLSGMEQYFGFR
jgi:hypothetical protein